MPKKLVSLGVVGVRLFVLAKLVQSHRQHKTENNHPHKNLPKLSRWDQSSHEQLQRSIHSHTSTYDNPTNCIYIIGGTSESNVSNEYFSYSISDETYNHLTSFVVAISYYCATMVNNKYLLIVGGKYQKVSKPSKAQYKGIIQCNTKRVAKLRFLYMKFS